MIKIYLKNLLFPLLFLLVLLGSNTWGDYVYLYALPAIGAVSFYLCRSKYEIIAQSMLILAISMFFSIDTLITSGTYLLVLSYILFVTLKKRISHVRTLFYAFILVTISLGIRVFLIEYMYGVDIWAYYIQSLKNIEIEIPKAMLSTLSNTDIEAQKMMVIEVISTLVPSLYIIAISFIITVNDFFATLILTLMRKPMMKFNRFFMYGTNSDQNRALTVIVVLSYITVYLFEFGGEYLLYNMLFLISFVFLLYGIACVSYIAAVLRFNILARLFLYAMTFTLISRLTPFPIIVMGMIDSLFGIRKQISKRLFGLKK